MNKEEQTEQIIQEAADKIRRLGLAVDVDDNAYYADGRYYYAGYGARTYSIRVRTDQ